MAKVTILTSDTISQWVTKTNSISDEIGDRANLTTNVDSDVVGAINSLDSDIGTLGSLATTSKTIVGAINENHTQLNNVDSDIGTLSSLTTTDKSSVVSAVNELDSDLGTISAAAMGTTAATVGPAIAELEAEIDTLNTFAEPTQSLTTTATTLADGVNELDAELGTISAGAMGTTASTVSGAIAELEAEIDTLNDSMGSGVLNTSTKNVVGAINELHTEINNNDSDIGTIGSLATSASNLVGAVNEIHTETNTNTTAIGTLGSLITSAQGNLVAAINEVQTEIGVIDSNLAYNNVVGNVNTLATSTQVSTVAAINELHGEINTNTAAIDSNTTNFNTNVRTVISVGSEGTPAGNGSLAYNNSTGIFTYTPPLISALNGNTDSLNEGTTNLYYTTARADSDAKASLFAVDAGGDGSFTYDSATGVMTYTGPSAAEVRAHISAGEGIDISSGAISGEDATTTNKGIASFSSTNFDTTSGAVSIKNDGVARANLKDEVNLKIYDADGNIVKTIYGAGS